jgi:hypothetical protein
MQLPVKAAYSQCYDLAPSLLMVSPILGPGV